jgi:2,3-bisphosphoglycerate-independent phosphoglycerate mutase
MRAVRVVMVFVDGVGLGDRDRAINPLERACTPVLRGLLGRSLAGRDVIRTGAALLLSLDATLGVPGLPQSATGQTALLTGENAAVLVGRHVVAYPTPTLQGLLASRGLFVVLRSRGVPAAFANAYPPAYFAAIDGGRLRRAAMALNAMQAGVRLRDMNDLRDGTAVYHDLTNARPRAEGCSVPAVTPEESGRHLAAIAARYAFTLFEFFQTDLAGHGRIEDRVEVVERLDRFLGGVLEATDLASTLLVLTSDHGNLEDERTAMHTLNPVPALLVGAGREAVGARLGAITDVAPALLEAIAAGSTVT